MAQQLTVVKSEPIALTLTKSELLPSSSRPRKPDTFLDKVKAGARAGVNRVGLPRKDWPMVAGGLAAFATGGAGVVPAILAAGAAGAGARGLDKVTDSRDDSARDVLSSMATEGTVQGVLEGAGRGVVAGGRRLAHRAMNRALGPTKAAVDKYGDLAQQLLDQRRRVSNASAAKFEAAQRNAQGAKSVELRRFADTTVPTQSIRDASASQTAQAAQGEALLAGLPTGTQPTRTISNFARRQPPVTPKPSGLVDSSGRPFPVKIPKPTPDVMTMPETEYALQRLNLKTDAARRQIAGPLARAPRLQDVERIALSKALRAAQDSVSPVLKQANQDIRSNFGMSRAIRDRLAKPGSGIADETAIFGSMVDPRFALGRIVREPQVLSTIALLVNKLSKGGKIAPNAARALMISSHEQGMR